VSEITFGPDGRTILARESGDPRFHLFRRPYYEPLLERVGDPIEARGDVHRGFAFSPDGKAILLIGRRGEARLWDTSTGSPIGGTLQAGGSVHWVAFDRAGKTMLTSTGSDVRRWEVISAPPGRELAGSEAYRFLSAALSPDGKTIALSVHKGNAAEVRFWDRDTGKSVGAFKHPMQWVRHLAYSPDGKVLLTVGDDNVRLWDTATHMPIGELIRVEPPIQGGRLPFSLDNKRLLVANYRVALMYDTTTAKRAGKPLAHEDSIQAVAFSPDGKRILTGAGKTARLWDAETCLPIDQAIQHPDAVDFVAFSPDGKKILTHAGRNARLWNAETGQLFGEPIRDVIVSAKVPLSFSPDGKTVLGGHVKFRLWDAVTGKPHGRYLHHVGGISSMAFSPDGKLIVISGDKGTQLWDTATGQPMGRGMGWTRDLSGGSTLFAGSALFSPDGRTILATSRDESRLFLVPQPVEGKPDQLRRWVEVITARELDAGGEVADLDAETWRQRWDRLQKLGGPP
jgi:WD40 repeat protein